MKLITNNVMHKKMLIISELKSKSCGIIIPYTTEVISVFTIDIESPLFRCSK